MLGRRNEGVRGGQRESSRSSPRKALRAATGDRLARRGEEVVLGRGGKEERWENGEGKRQQHTLASAKSNEGEDEP
jgi:hypothetical protein